MPRVRACIALLLWPCLIAGQSASAQSAADWATLDQQIEKLYLAGDLKESLATAQKALAAASNPKQTGRSLDRVGFMYYASGDVKTGEEFLRKSLDLRATAFGRDSADYAESANDLALLLRDTGRGAEARTLAGQAVDIRARLLGSKDPLLAESLNTLGTVLSYQGEYESAAARFDQAVAIQEQIPADRRATEEYGTLCVNAAGNLQRLGQYGKAEALFEKGLAALRINPGADHPAYSASLTAFAYLQMDMGNYVAAEKMYADAARLLASQLGEQHPIYATLLNNRGALYATIGNASAAEADFRKALELKRKLSGPDNPTVGATMRNLARVVAARSPEESEKLLREAVALFERAKDRPPYEYANTLLSLGEAQRKRGDLAGARQSFEKALEVAQTGLGTKHPLYASVLGDIGLVHQAAKEYGKAEERFREAIAIVTETHGPNHPDLARYLNYVAALDVETGKYAEAESLYRRGFEINDRFLTDILNVGSESSRAAVLANLEDPLPASVEFQERAGGQYPAARVLAFEVVARRKGRVLEAVRDWRQRLRETSGAAMGKRLDAWREMLECQSSLTIALGYRDLRPAVVGSCALAGTDLEGRYERLLHELRAKWTPALGGQTLEALGVLRRRIDTAEAMLSREAPQFASAVHPARLEDIRGRLAAREVLIEFVAWRNRYGAFLLDAAGDLRWTDLGPAKAIDAAVRDLLEAAGDWSTAAARRETQAARSAQETAREALAELSRKLLPALRVGKDVNSLRIAPDGMLTLIPFEALSDGRPLVERYTVSYVAAGRDLTGGTPEGEKAGPAVIAVSPGVGSKRPAAVSAGVFRAESLERLEGAEAEARRLRQRIAGAQLLGEGEATEQRIKQLRGPVLLHIIGHGIVRGKQDCADDRQSAECVLGGMDPAARVMNLSAIVLEEAYGRGAGSGQDGLLTARELETVDLHGTEMLVLSQCRMADGVPTSGDGVHGMRRAAAIAGVRTFVAPLWRVADEQQQRLMEAFYRELSAGKGRAEALRAAKLELLRKGQASFLDWAPVILSGDPSAMPAGLFAR
jgi:CHAT domain-containing protein/Tfp pilus assembly protein PilF